MFPTWKHEDCFPVIRDAILRLCEKKKTWILFDEIVDALLENGTVLRLVTGIDVWKDEAEREIAANMVAWFSQKITEFENGNLPENYKQIDLIEEACTLFDRRELEGRYAYKLREAPDAIPKARTGKATKVAILRQRRLEERRRKEEFAKLVEELKRQKVAPEEYRMRIAKWRQKVQNSRNQHGES